MTKGRVETIDVFRGIAILLVVLFHFTARLPPYSLNISEGAPFPVFFGWVGVYFFFIISGYCIFMTLERSASVGIFLARRISRIYPAFLAAVVLLFVFGLVSEIPSVPEAHFHVVAPTLADVAMNLFFIGEVGEWIDGSFWSIAVEVKFYLLVALLAAIFTDPARFARTFSVLALVMGLVWGLSTLFSNSDSGPVTPQSLLKFLTIAPYLTFFAIGILGRQMEAGGMRAGGHMLTHLLLSTAVIWVEAYSYELHAGVLAATICALAYLGLAVLFLRFVSGRSLPHIPRLTPAIAHVGLLSFSWYLIHENVGISIMATFDIYLPAWLSLVLAIISTFCMAVVFAHLFEHRFRKPVEKLAMQALDGLGRMRGLGALRTPAAVVPVAE